MPTGYYSTIVLDVQKEFIDCVGTLLVVIDNKQNVGTKKNRESNNKLMESYSTLDN